jgi:hypothetical protein
MKNDYYASFILLQTCNGRLKALTIKALFLVTLLMLKATGKKTLLIEAPFA